MEELSLTGLLTTVSCNGVSMVAKSFVDRGLPEQQQTAGELQVRNALLNSAQRLEHYPGRQWDRSRETQERTVPPNWQKQCLVLPFDKKPDDAHKSVSYTLLHF